MVSLVSLVAALGCGADPADHAPVAASGPAESTTTTDLRDDIYDQLAGVLLDHEPFRTLSAMTDNADLITVGRVVSIDEGRALGGKRGDRETLSTMLTRVRIE